LAPLDKLPDYTGEAVKQEKARSKAGESVAWPGGEEGSVFGEALVGKGDKH